MRIVDLGIQIVRGWKDAPELGLRRERTLARSWSGGGLGLVLLCLLVYLPGLWTIPPIDRDESRFAQASRQMLESGTLSGWVVPMVQDKPRLNKPPLIYWLQAASAWVLGDAPDQWSWLDGESENIWVYRVPSVLAAMLTVLLTWRLGARMFDPRAAWLGAAVLAVCPMVVWDAHQARADQLLLAMTTATMLCLWVVWKRGIEPVDRASRPVGSTARTPGRDARSTGATRWRWPILFWIFLTLGVMTKGPITPMVAGLTAVSLSLVTRRWRWMLDLKPLAGVVILAGVVGPWVYGVTRVLEDPALQLRMGIPLPAPGEPAKSGFAAYWSIIYAETIGRSAGAKEGHWGPPGYHIVLLGVLFWPGSLLTAAGIGRAWKRGLTRKKELNAEVAENAEIEKKGRLTSLRGSVASWLQSLYHARAGRPAELFCLAWMLPSWVVFEFVSTKLPHYTMPLYPAVALLSARMLFAASSPAARRVSEAERERAKVFLAEHDAKCRVCGYSLRGLAGVCCPECSQPYRISKSGNTIDLANVDAGRRLGTAVWLAIWLVLAVGVACGLWWELFAPQDQPVLRTRNLFELSATVVGLLIQALLSAVLFFKGGRLSRLGRFCGGVWYGVVGVVVLEIALLAWAIPMLRQIWISSEIVERVDRLKPRETLELGVLGCGEDSLVFQMRGHMTRLSSKKEAVDWIMQRVDRMILVRDEDCGYVSSGMKSATNMDESICDRYLISGWNYSKGRRERLNLLWRRP